MWIYLPVVKKIRRIALESAGGGYFMGSDFSYVDFISKSSSDFNLELVGEGELDGRACYIVKEYGSTQEQREALGYSSIINYYDKENYFMFARDYYEISGNLLKTYRVLEQLSFPPYIYPSEIIMTNVQTNHKSIIKVENISTKEVPDEYFTTRYLSR
jgi:hypothetical protein